MKDIHFKISYSTKHWNKNYEMQIAKVFGFSHIHSIVEGDKVILTYSVSTGSDKNKAITKIANSYIFSELTIEE